jgi:hypothetical protein
MYSWSQSAPYCKASSLNHDFKQNIDKSLSTRSAIDNTKTKQILS